MKKMLLLFIALSFFLASCVSTERITVEKDHYFMDGEEIKKTYINSDGDFNIVIWMSFDNGEPTGWDMRLTPSDNRRDYLKSKYGDYYNNGYILTCYNEGKKEIKVYGKSKTKYKDYDICFCWPLVDFEDLYQMVCKNDEIFVDYILAPSYNSDKSYPVLMGIITKQQVKKLREAIESAILY